MGVRWRIYYGDGSTFDDLTGSWEDAPQRNALVCQVTHEATGRRIFWGRDFFLWWPGSDAPDCVDWVGLYDYLTETGSPLARKPMAEWMFDDLLAERNVKLGRAVPDRRFAEIMAMTDADPDFPVRSAVDRKELDPLRSPEIAL